MAYGLDQFCTDANRILKGSEAIQVRLDAIAGRLSQLMLDEAFVNATFSAETPAGKRELYRDPEFDFRVLAHVQEGGKRGSPHSHGASWAIYGNINGATIMREYVRTNAESEEGAVLRLVDTYPLRRGDTRAYGPGFIHATEHPQTCWVIRITGTDLDTVERYRFRKLRDRVQEEA